eukprot:5517201-Amphidinium_carterae.1
MRGCVFCDSCKGAALHRKQLWADAAWGAESRDRVSYCKVLGGTACRQLSTAAATHQRKRES